MEPADWLAKHPNVAQAIAWHASAAGTPVGYVGWLPARKAQLAAEYQAYASGKPTPLGDPPANLLKPGTGEFPYTRLAEAEAWKLYLSHVAWSLHCEINRYVPWSVTGYPAAALRILFDSREFFRWRNTPALGEESYVGANLPGYEIDFDLSGSCVPAPPAQAIAFLRAAAIYPFRVGPGPLPLPPAQRRTTILRMVDWCRNLFHYAGPLDGPAAEQYWQYRGFPPAMRVLNGTVYAKNPQAGTLSYAAGCSGVAGLLRAVLRVLNIPVEIRRPAGHAAPWFVIEDIGLCHGDDPYMRRRHFYPEQSGKPVGLGTLWAPAFPVEDIFIDGAAYAQLFGPGLTAAQKDANVGATNLRLELEHLSYFLLSVYCSDLAVSPTATANVAAVFQSLYTPDALKAAKLWERLAAKLPTVGGCPVSS